MKEKQIKERINNLRREIEILEGVLYTKRKGFGRPKGTLKYKEEQITFLKENKNMKMIDLVELFNKTFGTNYPKETRALYNFMDRERIISPIRDYSRVNNEGLK